MRVSGIVAGLKLLSLVINKVVKKLATTQLMNLAVVRYLIYKGIIFAIMGSYGGYYTGRHGVKTTVVMLFLPSVGNIKEEERQMCKKRFNV